MREPGFIGAISFALSCALALASSDPAAAAAGDVTSIYVANDASGSVVVYRDGAQVCALEPSKSCMVQVTVGTPYAFRFVFSDGAERSFTWNGSLHFCAKEDRRVTNCAPPDFLEEYGN
jgi:hypothetical protein